jgi:type IV secretory pathway VirB10-like protein
MGPTGMSDNPALFSREIGTALYATFLGLITAIPSLVAWNYYNRKIEALGVEMERLCDEFLRRQYRHEKASPNGAAISAAPLVVTTPVEPPKSTVASAPAAPLLVRINPAPAPPAPPPAFAPAPEAAAPPVLTEDGDMPAFAPVFEHAPEPASAADSTPAAEGSHAESDSAEPGTHFTPGGAQRGPGPRQHGKGSKKGRHG